MCLGIPGQVIAITNEARHLARVSVSGVQREINLACIVAPDHPLQDCVGDWVLVHVGFAMSRIGAAEAAATLKVLQELGEVQEAHDAMRNSGLAAPGRAPALPASLVR